MIRGRVPRTNPNQIHCPVNQAIEPKARGRVPYTKPLFWSGLRESIIYPIVLSPCPSLFPTEYNLSLVVLNSRTSIRSQKVILVRPHVPFHLAAFNVRTLAQIGQQYLLANTLESFVCCVSETRIQDSSTVMQLHTTSLSIDYFLCVSGDDDAMAWGLNGVGIVLSKKVEENLVDWILVNSRICAIRLRTSIKRHAAKITKCHLFVIPAYALTDCSSESTKDNLLDRVFKTDI